MYIGKPIYIITKGEFDSISDFEHILGTTIIYTENGKSYDISDIDYIDVESIYNEKDEMKKIIKELLFNDSNELGWLKFKIDIKYNTTNKPTTTTKNQPTSWLKKILTYFKKK